MGNSEKNPIIQILEGLNAIKDTCFGIGYDKVTYKIKRVIGDIGMQKFNMGIAASGFPDEFDPEWLYDMVWYKMNENSKKFPCMDSIELVLESELSKKTWGGVKEDFDKLLVSNAKYRIMIFSTFKNDAEYKKAVEYCNDAVFYCSKINKGEIIDLIIWDECYDGDFKHIPIEKK